MNSPRRDFGEAALIIMSHNECNMRRWPASGGMLLFEHVSEVPFPPKI